MMTLGRYVNHSHLPNCEVRRSDVNGYPRMILLAKMDIDVGPELTYDYKFSWFNAEAAQVKLKKSGIKEKV